MKPHNDISGFIKRRRRRRGGGNEDRTLPCSVLHHVRIQQEGPHPRPAEVPYFLFPSFQNPELNKSVIYKLSSLGYLVIAKENV